MLIVERGDWLPREPGNWDTADVFIEGRYISPDTWYDHHGQGFQPQVHYFVGGATKLYGAALYRLRAEDFGELRHHDGLSPAWPISYGDLEPYYTAGRGRCTRCTAPGARTRPSRPASADYPFPALAHEPRIQQLADDLAVGGPPPVPRARAACCSTSRTCPTAPASAAAAATGSPARCTPRATPR